MRVLILGSGGREHALAWKLSSSPQLSALLCSPGNPGTASVAKNVAAQIEVPSEVVALAKDERIDLVVVGPEAPLVKGVADALEQAHVPVFGPIARAAAVEGSKAFSKEIMGAAGIPTAECRVFSSSGEAERYARTQGRIVVKADGLAGGKGVVVAQSADEAVEAVRSLSSLGEAGRTLVLEELLEGEEVSVIALCDGDRYALVPASQDHKRVGDGDVGPNTGGMGAYAPAPFLDREGLARVGRDVIAPALAELKSRGSPFRGALYAGLMLTKQGIRVLEFNCRFGDPETQVLMMQIADDLLPLLAACAKGNLRTPEIASRSGASVGVVIASEGYPQSPKQGDAITLPTGVEPGAQIFHAGTRINEGRLVTAGGRVLTVCASGSSISEARERAYRAANGVSFRGMHFRRDIGARAMPR